MDVPPFLIHIIRENLKIPDEKILNGVKAGSPSYTQSCILCKFFKHNIRYVTRLGYSAAKLFHINLLLFHFSRGVENMAEKA